MSASRIAAPMTPMGTSASGLRHAVAASAVGPGGAGRAQCVFSFGKPEVRVFYRRILQYPEIRGFLSKTGTLTKSRGFDMHKTNEFRTTPTGKKPRTMFLFRFNATLRTSGFSKNAPLQHWAGVPVRPSRCPSARPSMRHSSSWVVPHFNDPGLDPRQRGEPSENHPKQMVSIVFTMQKLLKTIGF